jgi:cytochrome P450
VDPNFFLAPEFLVDPHPSWRRLREEDPVHHSELLGGWLLSRYADVERAFRDDALSVEANLSRYFLGVDDDTRARLGPLEQQLAQATLLQDPPGHSRRRIHMMRGFTPARIEAMRPAITRIVDSLLDTTADTGQLEVVTGLAFPLPRLILARLLGVPEEDLDMLGRWSDDLMAFLGVPFAPPEVALQAQASMVEQTEYLRRLVARRRETPEDDLLSSLLAPDDHGDRLTEDEVLADASNLMFAGHETTTNLIAVGLLTLLRQPEALDLVRNDRSLLPAAVEEMLRLEPPVQMMPRTAKVAVTFSGRTVSPGDGLFLSIAAANRDPSVFESPDRLDPRRRGRSLAFGAGPHFCAGARLARLEALVALSGVLDRMPKVVLAEEPGWQPTIAVRALQRLMVAA